MAEKLKIDPNLYEYIIALNCSINETYIASISDTIKLKYITNSDVRSYLDIVFNFYEKHQKSPNATEIRTYLSTDELKQSYKAVLTKFKTLDTKYDFDELLANTEQYIKERAVFHAVKDTVQEVQSTNSISDTGLILDRFQDACNISLVDNLGFDYFNSIDEHIRNLSLVEKYIPTGYKWLDGMLGGGWLEGGRALYMFMGGTNVGKSIVLGNVATNLLQQNRTVVLITLEMSEDVYSKRISSQLSRIPIGRLKDETENLSNYLYTFRAQNPGAKLIVKEFPPSSISANNIRAYLKRLRMKQGIIPDVVVLDYLTLLTAVSPIGSMFGDGKKIAEEIRALSYPANFGCSFISACQINREGMNDANPDLDKSGESIAIPQTADASISLWQSEAERELGILNWGFRKNRFGPRFGTRAFKIDYDTLSIDEMESVFSNTDAIQDIENSLNVLSK